MVSSLIIFLEFHLFTSRNPSDAHSDDAQIHRRMGNDDGDGDKGIRTHHIQMDYDQNLTMDNQNMEAFFPTHFPFIFHYTLDICNGRKKGAFLILKWAYFPLLPSSIKS
jgi:hypothetical protein